MPTVQGTNDFDHAINAGYYADGFFGTPTAVSSPLYQNRGQTLQIDAAGANEGVRHNITGSPSRGWIGFPVRRDAAPSAGGLAIAEIHTATNNTRAQLRWSGSGGLLASIIGGVLGTEVATSAGQFYWVELILDASGTTHSLYFRLDGVDQGTSTKGSVSADTIDYTQLLSESGDSGLTWYAGGYWAYGSAANNTDWLGEPLPPGATLAWLTA